MHEPFLLMVAGPNGAGKTTLTRSLREQGIEFGEYVNPDDVALELEGSYETRVSEVQKIADERRHRWIAAKRSLSFETVMSHPSKIDILSRAKAAGYFVQLFFVGVDDPRTNVERVALRAAQGAHAVPEDRIIARWYRTMGFLAQAILVSDRSYVFDNSESGKHALGPRLVVQLDASPEMRVTCKHYAAIPDWVRHFVLHPLEKQIAS